MTDLIFMEIIPQVGFPIAAFILMWTFANKTLKENTKAIQDLSIVIKAKLK